ncbi:MAG: calcium-binding protein [Bauldia sp.]|nr:calcium-binding protein [Bauldia sp.]
MVKIVAKQPVNEAALEKLGLLLDPTDVDFSNTKSSGFTAEAGDVRIVVKGTGIKYVPFVDVPMSGTITKIKAYFSDALAYTISKAEINIKKLANASDVESAIKKILSGNDLFKGSSGDDLFAGGGKNDKLLGKGGNDTLAGDAGKDKLDGGDGSDTLDGGKGKDTYFFKDAPGSGVDTIVNFESGEKFKVSKAAFDGLTKGELSADQFVEGTSAGDANDRFIYDSSTGAVYFDRDGTGSAAQVQFAHIVTDSGNFGAGSIIVI